MTPYQIRVILTEEEKTLGFRHLMIEADGYDPMELNVAYVVNESEIVVKTSLAGEVRYKHMRRGLARFPKRDDVKPLKESVKWHPLGMTLYEDPGEAIQGSEFNPDYETLVPIEPRKFKWEPFDPAKHGS